MGFEEAIDEPQIGESFDEGGFEVCERGRGALRGFTILCRVFEGCKGQGSEVPVGDENKGNRRV